MVRYQRWLQHLLDDLGRSDIGIGNVEVDPPRLLFTLHNGHSSLNASLPLAACYDHTLVMRRLLDLVVRFNRDRWSEARWKAKAQHRAV